MSFYGAIEPSGVHANQIELPDTREIQRQTFLTDRVSSPDSAVGSLTLLGFSTVALFAAILLPSLVSTHQYITMRHLWIASQGIFGLSMFGTFFFTSTIGTISLFSVVGFSWAASVWIPYALLGAEISSHPSQSQGAGSILITEDLLDREKGQRSHSESRDGINVSDQPGLIYGLHNVSICLPQMLVTLGLGFQSMLSADNSNGHGDQGLGLVWVLRFGGCCAFVAAYLAMGIEDSG